MQVTAPELPLIVLEGGGTPVSDGSGSVGHLQNQIGVVQGRFKEPNSPLGSGDGYNTPPRRSLSASQGGLFDGGDGWTTDSRDTMWAPDFADFTGMNSSDDNNLDWILHDEEELPHVEEVPLNVDEYRKYTYVDPIQQTAIERIRYLYRDSEGDTSQPVLTGDWTTFNGPFLGPTQRHIQNKPTARAFFDR